MAKDITRRKILELSESDFVDDRATRIVDGLRNVLSRVVGVTVVGTQLTMRFKGPLGNLLEVSCVVTSVTDEHEREPEEEDK